MRIIIPGDPLPKARHRSFIRHGHIATYDNQVKQMNRIRLDMIEQRGEWRHEDKPLRVDLIFQLDAQKGSSKAESSLKQWWSHFPIYNAAAVKKIDLDNTCKTYFDCGNEILWSDDRFIVQMSCRKEYSKNPCTIIEITPIYEVKMSAEHEKVFKTFSPQDIQNMACDVERIQSSIFRYCESGDEVSEERLKEASQLMIDFANEWADKLKKIKGK
jgi:Holliday junction resolvase RusA-like endonuclease